ncbi:Putative uncharacterized protein [Lactococcus lactis subsp. lactis A12]|uniref:Uncharacterized protein n=1 Tax=Lactococcus lactis subsp. lactis A12 TaxID=1137134 RepID=S6F3M4_LACLL|nr:Putative uncharacterized protein [Lactococcus lactis subsp. lactis A12]SBW31459.1 Hypothetical protein LLA12_02325 [Lactococcus lactis subsp. lactis]
MILEKTKESLAVDLIA